MKLSLPFLFVLILLLLTPNISFANGGDQRVVEGKYLINLSRSPFTPKANEKTAFIASFVDIQTDKLIVDDLLIKIRIAKLGGDRERTFIFEKNDARVKDGILEFQYTFTEPGLHEIFFDFVFASTPQKVYNAPDFLMDIQKPDVQGESNLSLFIVVGLGAIIGFIAGRLMKRKRLVETRF